jgi:AraC-like DNA-binding protein
MKIETGLSAGEFIMNIRLEHAWKLLSERALTVKETAYKCGFNDSSYFTKCFKKKYGKLPTDLNRARKK